MSGGVLYITHARKPVERIECNNQGMVDAELFEAYMGDPSIMGYVFIEQPPHGLVRWHCYWFTRQGRQCRSFDEVNLPKDIKAMRLIGL